MHPSSTGCTTQELRLELGSVFPAQSFECHRLLMTEPWQMVATWGVFSGVGSGAVATVLGATIVNRWFKTNRGLMMGLMSAIEPLRVANRFRGELYRWRLLSLDGADYRVRGAERDSERLLWRLALEEA